MKHTQNCIRILSQAMGLYLLLGEDGHHTSEEKPEAQN